MFDVIEKRTGKRRTVYAVRGERFIVGVKDGFVSCDMAGFTPAPKKGVSVSCDASRPRFAPVPKEDSTAPVDTALCLFSTIQRRVSNLDELLAGIMLGNVRVGLGDMISIRLLDGTEVDLVVTDQDDKTVRLESRDCLGVNTSACDLDGYLEKVYALLPDALKGRIMEVERAHLNSDGERFTKRCKLFVPAASEIFPADECYGDTGLYQQMEWYKDTHNRVRADHKGGDSHWYWTSSPGPDSSTSFRCVNSSGGYGNASACYTYGLAPFGCIISKI